MKLQEKIFICLILITSVIMGVASVSFASTREKLNFDYGWKFSKGQGYINSGSKTVAGYTNIELPKTPVTVIPDNIEIKPYQMEYSMGGTWEDVSLPHTYNDIDTFDHYTESGQNGERSMYSGTAWYKKTFTIPVEYEGQKIYIEFEAARQAAVVYVNGQLVPGKCENGFIPFGYDLTPYINFGGTNDITVMVDNTFPYYDESGNAIPWHDSHWHPNFGGLYRNVYLYIMDPVHLTLPLYSFTESQGTYIYTTDETATSAKFNIDAEVENCYEGAEDIKNVTLVANIKDKDGTIVESITGNAAINPLSKTNIQINTTISNPHFWSTDYPYLYTVECILKVGSTIVDTNTTQIGIRTFRITTDAGFYLNENYMKLAGWGQKPTSEWAGLGSAYPDWMHDYVTKKMKDGGGNYIRFGHCAGGPAQIAGADKYGLLVTQPGVDGEGNYGGASYATSTMEIRQHAFRDMVIYYRNNPSIIAWEFGNQSNAFSSESAAEFERIANTYDYGNRNNGNALTNTGTYLSTLTHESSDRFLTMRQGSNTTKPYQDVSEVTQGGDTISGLPVIEGEYNRYEARRGVWDTYTFGFSGFTSPAMDSSYNNYTSELFSKSQVTTFINQKMGNTERPGGANWIFSDSTSHGRLYEEVARASGEVDATMLEKDAYWVCKVLYENKPGVHIIGHWNYPAETTKNIYVVAKGADTVKLYLNDTLIGNGTVSETYLYTFSNVAYEPGTIRVECYKDGNVIATDSITSHGEPYAVRLTKVNEEDVLANGSDILLIDAEVVDENGNRCLTYDGQTLGKITTFNVNTEAGTSIWRGGYNSHIEESTNKTTLYIEAGITRVALKTTQTPGTIEVSATIDGLIDSNIISVNTQSVVNTNGYSTVMPQPLAYTMGTEVEYGDGAKFGTEIIIPAPEQIDTVTPESKLMTNLYYPSDEPEDIIEKYLLNGMKPYNDETTTFKYVPYKYQGAEYLQLANSKKTALAVDLIGFTTLQDVTVIVLRDEFVPVPSWMSGFTKTDDIVVLSNNKVLRAYTKQLLKGENITIGSNGENSELSAMGLRNIIAVKETTKVTNSIYFAETFDTFDTTTFLPHGWKFNIVDNSEIKVINSFFDKTNVLRIYDMNTSSMNNTIAQLPKQSGNKFEISYDIYIKSTKDDGTSGINNNWIRTWLHASEPVGLDNTDKTSTVLMEIYPTITPTTTQGIHYNTGTTNSKLTDLSLDSWHNVKFVVDLSTNPGKFTCCVDNGTPTDMKNVRNNFSTLEYIQIGSGGAHTDNFYVDNLTVTPIIESPISGINIQVGDNSITAIPNFNVGTNAYLYEVENLDDVTPVVTVTQSELCIGTPSVELDDVKATIRATNIDGDEYVYEVYFTIDSLVELNNTSSYTKQMRISPEITPNVVFNKTLEKDGLVYKNDTIIFDSVPYSIQSAEYFIMDKNLESANGKISITAREELDVFILKQLSDTSRMTGFEETTMIVTASNGTIYRVWKKTTPVVENTEFSISIQNLVEGDVCNNIIAFKSHYDVTNRILEREDFSSGYAIDELPHGWELSKEGEDGPQATDTVQISDSDPDANNEELALEIKSSVYVAEHGSMALTYAELPKMYDKFRITFTAKVTDSYLNKWMRIWLLEGEPDVDNFNYKKNVVFESYLHNYEFKNNANNFDIMYKRYQNNIEGSKERKITTGNVFSANTWYTLTYEVDLKTRTATVYRYDEETSTNISCGTYSLLEDAMDLSPRTMEGYVNYIAIGTARNSTSQMYLKDIEIEVVPRETITSINADGEPLTVHDMRTEAFLCTVEDINNLPEVTVDLTDPVNDSAEVNVVGNCATITVDNLVNYSAKTYNGDISSTITDSIHVPYTYKVYFVQVDKSELNTAITSANALIEENYTSATWSAFDIAKINAMAVQANNQATQNQIDDATLALTTAQSGLEELGEDVTAPVCTIIASTADITAESIITYTFNFSENVYGFEASDIVVTNGTVGKFTETTANRVYTLVVTNNGPCSQSVSVGAGVCIDGSSNANESATKTVTIVSIDLTNLNTEISTSNTIYNNDVNPGYTTDSWAIFKSALLAAQEITIDDTQVEADLAESNLSVARTGLTINWTILESELTASEDEYAEGINPGYIIANYSTFKLAYENALNVNTNRVGKTLSEMQTAKSNLETARENLGEINTARPTCIITTNVGDATIETSVTYTFTFSKNVTGFTIDDITVTNGEKGTFTTVNGNTYTLVVTSSIPCIQEVSVPADICIDESNNGNELASKQVQIGDVNSDVTLDTISSFLSNLTITARIYNDFGFEKTLEKERAIYKDSTLTFDSIPYSMQGAEYFLMNKNLTATTEKIKFETTQLVDLFMLRDVEAETEITDFVETKMIVTANDGRIYRVWQYKNSIQTEAGVPFEILVSSIIVNSDGDNSIIAIKSHHEFTNRILEYQDYSSDEYIDGELPHGWYIKKFGSPSGQENDHSYIEDGGLMIESTVYTQNNGSMIMAYTEIPKQTDKFKVRFTAKVPTSSYTNGTMRVWLTQGDPSLNAYDYKDNVVFESYLHKDTKTDPKGLKLIYRRYLNGGTTSNNLSMDSQLNFDQWYTYTYEIDLKNETATVYKYNEETLVDNLVGTYDISEISGERNLTYANYIVLGSAFNGTSKMCIKDIDVETISRQAVTGINVGEKALTLYDDRTSAFLCNLDDISTLPTVTPVLTDSVNDTYTIETGTNYRKINVTDNEEGKETTTISYTIYFKQVDRITLRQSITSAEEVTNTGYTSDSWTLFTEALENANVTESDIQATQTMIDLANTTLTTAQSNLTEDTVTISFDSNGGSSVVAITQKPGTTVVAPSNPTKEGYIFEGWYGDVELETEYTFGTMPSENITVYAKWNINKAGLETAIANAQSYGATNTGYTSGSWTALQTRLGEANTEKLSSESTVESVNTAVTNLDNAIANLAIDWSILGDEITASTDEYNGGTNPGYVAEKYNAFKTAYDAAVTMNTNKTETLANMQGAKEALVDAREDLGTLDNVAPTCVITASTSDTTNAESVTYTFEFDENVNGFTVDDVNVTNGSKGTFTVVDGNTYTLVVTNSGACTQEVSISANVCEDRIGNGNTESSKTITIELTDLTDLNTSISTAEGYTSTNPGYTSTTWNAMRTALTNAKAITGRNTVREVIIARETLDNAIDSLRADMTDLRNEILEAEEIYGDGTNTKYTETSWNNFVTKLQVAQDIEDTYEISDIENATANLRNAISSLRTVTTPSGNSGSTPSKSTLENVLSKAASLDEENYTEESWKQLEKAIKDGKEIIDDKNATRTQIIRATNDIDEAIENLEKKVIEKQPDDEKVFIDIDTHWAKKSIESMTKIGLFNGVGDNKFAPESLSTRGMIVTILYRIKGEPNIAEKMQYSDVDTDEYYTDAIIWASKNEIVKGIGNNQFAPESNVTREQFATMMFNYATKELGNVKVEENKVDEFKDKDSISTYAVEPLNWAVANGIIQGRGDGIVAPGENATRAELATMVERFTEYLQGEKTKTISTVSNPYLLTSKKLFRI